MGAVETVLEFGGLVGAEGRRRKTPLLDAGVDHRAGAECDKTSRVVDALLAAGANAEARDANGMTALHSACKFGNGGAVESPTARRGLARANVARVSDYARVRARASIGRRG